MLLRCKLFIAGATTLATIGSPVFSGEWDRFRGPNGSGVVQQVVELPVAWSADELNWQLDLPGIGHSSPVIFGDKIFVTSADPATGDRMLLCISSAGEKLWTKQFESTSHHVHLQNSLASSTPAVSDNHVYMAWGTPEELILLAVDHKGNEAWRRNLGPYISEHGFGTSPIVYEDLVIMTNDQDGVSFVVAVDSATGDDRWRVARKTRPLQNASYSAPIIRKTASGDELILNSWAHGVTSLDPKSGKQHWEIAAFHNRPVSTPILTAELILGTCGNGGGDNSIVAVRPPKSPGAAASIAYKIPKSLSPYVPSLVSDGERVFAWTDRGIVSCIEAASGKVVATRRIGGNFSGSPILAGDRLYAISADGDVVVISADDELKVLAKNSLDDGCRGTPAVADGVIYLRTETKLFSVGRPH